MTTYYYVTAVAVPNGATSLEGLHRTDMGKFPNEVDAKAHLEYLRGPAFYDLQIETREEAYLQIEPRAED